MSNLNRLSSKCRLDQLMVKRGLVATRSEAGNWIALGKVTVDGRVETRPGRFVDESTTIKLKAAERYVSRAGLKLASVAGKFGVEFAGKVVLDVGSSTGGFTDYALQHGAAKVIAVDVGTDQMHPSLRDDPRVELHEKTDIRDVFIDDERWTVDDSKPQYGRTPNVQHLTSTPGIVVIDVSFVSLREVLPHVSCLLSHDSMCLAMVKPQFEASRAQLTKDGIIKNDRIRRDILQDFERWAKQRFVIIDKADSQVVGAHGNRERFYMLKLPRR